MTTLDIDYKNFEDYLSNCLSPRTRGKVRRKLRAAERARPAITMSVVGDVTPFIEDVYPLYEKVYERSPLQFEKLTKEFLCEIGRRMPDKVRFFIWRQENHIIAFGLCTMQGDAICHEYVGFDYAVAFELNLYYRVFHDIIEWAIANGYKRFYSGSLNYDPKWHLRQSLYPVDLYVRHTSRPLNAVLRRVLPLMEPTRSDPILPQFSQLPRALGLSRRQRRVRTVSCPHRNQTSQFPLTRWAAPYAASRERGMTANSASSEVEVRRRPARGKDKGVVDLAGDALKEIATLIQTELQLLRAEISEKLSFTALSVALIGAGGLLLMATIVLLLQAAVAGLVAYGFSLPVAALTIAAVTLSAGAGLVWLGVNRLSFARLAPSKTLDQLQKDSTLTKEI